MSLNLMEMFWRLLCLLLGPFLRHSLECLGAGCRVSTSWKTLSFLILDPSSLDSWYLL